MALMDTLRAKIPLMAKPKNKYEDEDNALWARYKGGDKDAGWELLNRFKPIISQHASKFSNVLPRPAVEAKLKVYTMGAFDTYDPSKKTKLSTHVYNYLQQINRDNYKHQQAIRLPENYARGFGRFQEGKAKLHESFGREPTGAELSEYLGWSLDQVAKAEHRYHTELVEGKQEFSSPVIGPDIGKSALRFAYDAMNDDERFLMEHKIGYMNKQVLPVGVIRERLKYTPHKFNVLQKGMEEKVRSAYSALSDEEDNA